MNTEEEHCIEVYMSYHVSEVSGLDDVVKRAWYNGQRLNEERKKTCNK